MHSCWIGLWSVKKKFSCWAGQLPQSAVPSQNASFPHCTTFTDISNVCPGFQVLRHRSIILLLDTHNTAYGWVPRGLLRLSPPLSMSLDSRSSMGSLRTPPRKSYATSRHSWRRKGCPRVLCLGAAPSLRLPGRVRLVRCMNCWSRLSPAGNVECQVRTE